MFIASVRPSVRPSVCLVVWKQNLTMMQGPRSGLEGGPQSGPEKLSSAPRSTSSTVLPVRTAPRSTPSINTVCMLSPQKLGFRALTVSQLLSVEIHHLVCVFSLPWADKSSSKAHSLLIATRSWQNGCSHEVFGRPNCYNNQIIARWYNNVFERKLLVNYVSNRGPSRARTAEIRITRQKVERTKLDDGKLHLWTEIYEDIGKTVNSLNTFITEENNLNISIIILLNGKVISVWRRSGAP